MDIPERIAEYRNERGWTEYLLAEKSGLPQSTISSWYGKNMTPSFSSLEKICMAFGISMSQFFAENDDRVVLDDDQKKLLKNWNRLSPERKATLLAFLEQL